MRKLIGAMKISADGKMLGPDGVPDWVDAWSDDYGLTSEIDACILGATMYPGYERYWTAIRNAPDQPIWITGQAPTPAEREWAEFAARTPHFVLSNTMTSTSWPNTRFLRNIDEIAELKKQPGKDIYLVGGALTTASLMDAGLVDEIRLIVHPLIVGDGQSLFETIKRRHGLEFSRMEPLEKGRMGLTYRFAA